MQFEGTRRSGQAPNLTPLIDIVFLLLVFFMLTAHFVNDEGLPIELPEAITATSFDELEPIEVAIERSGALRLAGAITDYKSLSEQLSKALVGRSDKRVVIRGDSGVTLGDSVRVIDAARSAGAAGIDIITEKPQG